MFVEIREFEMGKNNIACCYFPTTVLFVDDNGGYLKSMRPRLDRLLYYHFYTDPKQALLFIQKECKPTPFIDKWLMNLKDSALELGGELEGHRELEHTYVDIDYSAIHKEIYDPERYKELSVLVIDYAMPRMNGLEFCEKIKDLPIKKLMLTGQGSLSLGVEALNAGLIDKFVTKTGAVDLRAELNTAIAELQQQYFNDQSRTVIDNLATSARCCLSDPVFTDFFHEFCRNNNIAEYYLVNDTGSMLLLDIEGKPSWLAVASEPEMQRRYDSVHDNEGPKEMAEALRKREKLLFLMNTDDEYLLTAEAWKSWVASLHNAKKLIGAKDTYYYAHIVDAARSNISLDKIASYHEFLLAH